MNRTLFHIVLFCLTCLASYSQRTYTLERLPLNSKRDNEMAPAFFEGGIVFTSNRRQDGFIVTKNQNDQFLYNIYFVEKKKNGWGTPRLFTKDLSSRYNESSITFSTDNQMAYLTRTQTTASSRLGDILTTDTAHGIFMSSFNGSSWGSPRPFRYTTPDFHSAFPSLSPDGTKLFFCSEDPAGYGGYDIYVSERRNGVWQTPENLGPTINTAENEVSPFIHSSGRLYFASRGHAGNGGLDIFYSDYINNQWTIPANLPRPFNSLNDDFAYIVNVEMDTGYFTSNRSGTDDIFMFTSDIPAFPDCPIQIEEDFCYAFSESGSMNLDTTAFKYEWDLGDGTKVRSLTVDHCFPGPGEYLISLNVIDTLTGEIYFSEATYNLLVEKTVQPYIIAIDTAVVDEVISMNASESHIVDFTIEDYYWDFGDAKSAKGEITSTRYTKPGNYFIKLGVTGPLVNDPSQYGKACVLKEIVILRNK